MAFGDCGGEGRVDEGVGGLEVHVADGEVGRAVEGDLDGVALGCVGEGGAVETAWGFFGFFFEFVFFLGEFVAEGAGGEGELLAAAAEGRVGCLGFGIVAVV